MKKSVSIPTKWDDKEVKKQSIALKYRLEQEHTSAEAILACPTKAYAVELYAGTGGLTKIYKKFFVSVITNDANKNVDTMYHEKAMWLIKSLLARTKHRKIDLIDFDCYGCPALEIQEYFKVRGDIDAPLVLRFSDGLGLYMKRNKKEDVVRKRYLIEGPIVMDKIWKRHPELIDYFFKKIAGMYGMKAEKICSMQTKYLNYTLGAYRFTKI